VARLEEGHEDDMVGRGWDWGGWEVCVREGKGVLHTGCCVRAGIPRKRKDGVKDTYHQDVRTYSLRLAFRGAIQHY
jgi:hypothetical protein